MAAYSAGTADLTGSGDPAQLQVGGVTAQFFDVLGVRPEIGRTFAAGEDVLGRHRVVVLSHVLWQQRFGGDRSIVGRPITLSGVPQEVIGVLRRDFEFPGDATGRSGVGQRVQFTGDTVWREVVRVIADVRHWGLDREANPELYMPHDQQPSTSLTYVLHTAGDPIAIAEAVASHVHAVDPNLPTGAIRTLDQIAATTVAARRWSAVLLGLFAMLGVVLAGAGIYGVMAHVVSMRTSEIAVRMSLGARPASVMRSVLGEAMAQTGVGLAVGLMVAYVSMRALKALLFNVTERDPLAFAVATATVLVAALLAGTIPAWRAMRVDPMRALRAD